MLQKLEAKIEKEVVKAQKRFGDDFDERICKYTPTCRFLRNREKIDTILKPIAKSLENEDLADVKALIEELDIADPANWF